MNNMEEVIDSGLEEIARYLRCNGILCARSGESYLVLDRREHDDDERIFDKVGELRGQKGRYYLRLERAPKPFSLEDIEGIVERYVDRFNVKIELEIPLICR